MPILNAILDMVFPVKCLSCGIPGKDLCLNCLRESPEAERESAKWIFPIYDYRHPSIKKALWLLKYKGKKRLAGILAESLYGRMLEELADLLVLENFDNVILVPIPLSSRRLRERGYNQVELICEELLKLDQGKNFTFMRNILVKPRETIHQAKIENRSERLRNIIGSFIAENREKIKNRNIILIDDITTTGATLNEARKTLKQAGARKIIAFSVAH